jgi:hypothetical protein
MLQSIGTDDVVEKGGPSNDARTALQEEIRNVPDTRIGRARRCMRKDLAKGRNGRFVPADTYAMSFLSSIRNRVTGSIHAAEDAAAGVAAKAEDVVKGAAATAKAMGRGVVGEAPSPSAASLAHAARASADFARNASPALGKTATHGKGPGVFAGFGASAAAGGDVGIGGQASAGYLVGANGDLKEYGSTGTVNGSLGASAGVGFEAGIVRDIDDFYGDGYQVSISGGAVSASLSFTSDKKLVSGSLSVGKSVGAGLFHFDTHTEDRTGR